jgi:hypothetical protein
MIWHSIFKLINLKSHVPVQMSSVASQHKHHCDREHKINQNMWMRTWQCPYSSCKYLSWLLLCWASPATAVCKHWSCDHVVNLVQTSTHRSTSQHGDVLWVTVISTLNRIVPFLMTSAERCAFSRTLAVRSTSTTGRASTRDAACSDSNHPSTYASNLVQS